MSKALVSENTLSVSEIPQDEVAETNGGFKDFTDEEGVIYDFSEEGSRELSGYSVFTEGSIVSYEPAKPSEHELVPDDPLMAVPPKDYPDMLFRMGNDFPNAIHAYEHVRSLIRWKTIYPKREIAILAPGGDYKNGIIFFSVYKGNFHGSAYCFDNRERAILEEAFATSKYAPIKQHYNIYRLTCLTFNTYQAFKTYLPRESWCTSADIVLWLPWYCAREMKVNLTNEDLKIQELGPEHVDLINEQWQENFPGSRDLIENMFQVHNGLGLFQEDCLLSWALVWCHGGIGIIQTIDSEKGKGYCRPIVEALTKRMGELLIDVHLNITRGRRREVLFFMKLGFRYAFQAFTCETKKKVTDKKPEPKTKDILKSRNVKDMHKH